jgi:hypothetical protein
MNPLKYSVLLTGLLIAALAARASTDVPPPNPAVPATAESPVVKLPAFAVKGTQFLGLKNGSLIESIYFRNVWIGSHPDEDAIVLVTSADGKDGKYPPVTAVTVYSNNGNVWAHSTDYGPVPLGALKPDDLKGNAAHCLDVYLKTVAKLPLKPKPVVGTSDEQVQRAFDAVHDPELMPYFPVAIADVPGTVKNPDGTLQGTTFKCLVFDWNDAHYLWRPSMGAHREDPPIEPLTGRPLLCVKHSDLVEALIFVHDYQKAHPEEKAVLLYAPYTIDANPSTSDWAAAAYTVKGVVYIRSCFATDFPADGRTHPCAPADLDKPQALATLFQQYKEFIILSVFDKIYQKSHPGEAPPENSASAYYDTLPSVFPQSLPWDTAEMQENRVFQRAVEAGIPCDINPGKIWGRRVHLHWRLQRFSYTSSSKDTGKPESYFNGVSNPNEMNRLIDAILFAQNFKPEHPGDTVVVLPYRQPGLWEIVQAVAVYAREGKVWVHNPICGETCILDANPEDLSDPKKFDALRVAANNAIRDIEKAKSDQISSALGMQLDLELDGDVSLQNNEAGTCRRIFEILTRPGDMSNVEVTSVCKTLKSAGIDCKFSTTTTERGPDGKLSDYALPSLGFTFQGVRYTYGPEHYCSVADNMILDP